MTFLLRLCAFLSLVAAGPALAQTGPSPLDRAVESAWPNLRPELAARIAPDETMAVCSAHRNRPPEAVASAIQAREQANLRLPADGVLMGDWRRGERGALSGYGLRMGDDNRGNGGNCFACHQMTAAEVSYGTLGPSLLGYGRSQGADPATQRRVYEKIYNPHATMPCSMMPRFGANGVLTLEAIRDYVAFLLDPESPVNR